MVDNQRLSQASSVIYDMCLRPALKMKDSRYSTDKIIS